MSVTNPFDDYQWLVGPAAERWLSQLAGSASEPLGQAARLRKELSATRVHLLLEQTVLRRRARKKFAAADRMFFTPIGLEQATDDAVAAYKAGRLPAQAAVWDFCCGIGGDLMAIARRGTATGVDRNAVAALLAEANCRALVGEGCAGVELRALDVANIELADAAAWHIDPDRRSGGRRATRVEQYEPGLPVVERLLAACPAAAIKLAPAAEPPLPWQSDAELEWISRGGECRQLVAWFGPLAQTPGRRRATVVSGRGEGEPRTLTGDPYAPLGVAARLGRYVAEPDAAVLAAGLTGTLAAERDLAAIAPGAVYLTGDRMTRDAALHWFEISDVAPFDIRRFKALLRERGVGRLEVKKRGVSLDPAQVRRQLRVPGENRGTLLLARLGDTVVGILAQRIV